MTHISESEFEERYVEPYLEREFPGGDVVGKNKWVDGTGGYPDYWLDFGDMVFAIEVENDADSIRDGCGQAQEYASHLNHPNAVPVLLTPEGHSEQTTVETFRARGVIIIELETNG